MKTKHLFENDRIALVRMMTSAIRNIQLNPKEVVVKYKKHPSSQKKQCFNNSFRALSEYPDSLYVLGYVFFHSIPIEHAWVKQGDTYYDVTLDPEKQDGYVSIAEFSLSDIMSYVDKYKHSPSLYDINRFKGLK